MSIERRIRNVSPFLITARHHHKWPPYIVYTGYKYLGEISVMFAGIGLATPVTALMAKTMGPANGGEAAATDLGTLGTSAFIVLLIWIITKVFVQQESLERRCSLLGSYRRQCRQMEFELEQSLRDPDPMPRLEQLQLRLNDLIDRSIAEDAIVGNGVDERWREEWEKYSKDLIDQNSEHWPEPPASAQRPKKEGEGP